MTATDEASDALAAMSLKMNKTQQRTRERKSQHSKRDSVEYYYCHKLGSLYKELPKEEKRRRSRHSRREEVREEEQRV